MKNKQNLTEGNVFTVLLRFSLPFVAANLIQALYGAVDLLVIGRYCSPESVAAVSTGTQVTQIITSMITGLTLGGTILVGKYTGMNNEEEVRKTIGTTLSIFAIAAAFLTCLMLVFVSPVLRFLKTPEESFGLAKLYVMICCFGIFFICGYNAVSAVLRGYGDSKRPMMFVAFSCVLNIIGDFVLVGVFHLGVAGVAIATIGSQAISMCFAVWYLNKSRFIFTFTLKNFRIDREKAKELAFIGIPISLQESMVRFSFLYLTSVTNQFGIYAASAVGIASKYDVFAMLPATSVANALAAITAQNYGAGKPERAERSLKAGLSFALSASALFWLWAQLSPETMLGIFTRDRNIINAGIPFFIACSYDYLSVTFVFCMNGYLNGRSKTLFTMASSSFGALALRLPLIHLFHHYWPDNLFLMGIIAPAVSAFMAVYTLIYVGAGLKREREGRFQTGSGGIY